MPFDLMLTGYLALQREWLLIYVLIPATPRRVLFIIVGYGYLSETLDLIGYFLCKYEFSGP